MLFASSATLTNFDLHFLNFASLHLPVPPNKSKHNQSSDHCHNRHETVLNVIPIQNNHDKEWHGTQDEDLFYSLNQFAA